MSETRFGQYRRGQGLGLLILLLVGGLAIWFGYGVYVERYYIALFDGDMVRYLDLPPYARRITPERDELRGHAEMTLETVPDQVCNFLGLLSTKRGFILRRRDAAIDLEIRPGYVVKGLFKDNKLVLDWNPVLNESRKARKAKLESEGKLPAGSVASATAMPGGSVTQGS